MMTVEEKNKRLEEELNKAKIQIEELKNENEKLLSILRNLNRKTYAGTTEQNHLLLQLQLFNDAEYIEDHRETEPSEETVTVKEHKRKKKSALDGDNIEIKTIHHPMKDTTCPVCGSVMKQTGQTVIEQLKYHPGSWVLEKHIIYNYECQNCAGDSEGNPFSVPSYKVPQLIEGSKLTPSVFAYIFVEKFIKSVPLYRIEAVLNKEGIYLSRQIMSYWFLKVMEIYLGILVSIMKEDQLKEDILYGDETTVKCLEETKHENNYMWMKCTSPYSDRQIYVYSYHCGRDGEYCRKLYEGFEGYLHCDCYGTYSSLEKVETVGCWDHARRRIVEAIDGDVLKVQYDKCLKEEERQEFLKCHEGFKLKIDLYEMAEKLYMLEREYKKKKLKPEEIKEARNKQSKPVLEKIRMYLDRNYDTFLEGGKMEDAVHYLSNHWEAFVRYLEDGRLEMTNGRSERAIKDFVIGRKNWLFCNTERGAEASSDAYSLAATIKANHLKPFEYITYVLEEMMKMESPDEKKLRELLPYSGTLPGRLIASDKN